MLFTTQWVSTVLPEHAGVATDQIPIEHITTNSKQKLSKSLFIPIVGERFDGHDFIKEAFDNGAIAAVWDKKKERPRFLPTDFPLFYTDDTTFALQQLAAAYRRDVDPIVVGITGSNGKTSTKDMVAAIGKTSYRTHHTLGNFNNLIGLPLTILSMPSNTELLVLEMGMDRFGEIEQLSNISKPDIAIITNIGESHLEFLGSREGIAKAKVEILSGLHENGALIIDGDEPLLAQTKDLRRKVVTCGLSTSNQFTVSNVQIEPHQTRFTVNQNDHYTIPLLGKHHAVNATYAIQVGKLLKVDDSNINRALAHLEWTAMRFEIMKGTGGASIINDAYNASPTSMKAAIDVVQAMQGYQNKILVLGDIYELGPDSLELHRSVVDHIDEAYFTAVFTIGKDASAIADELHQRYPSFKAIHVEEKYDIINDLKPYLQEDSLILFKASRGMQFETLIERLINPS
ncbi:UDP-N-acetylmuramoyl-tripeptide--D-alanyl-D-alanine ligase [Lentibacillus saliphilus]|uniref:UDP-N-acetylmuramoyl-tripeptide--D-alanyl-D- alanine ligase n=1 Tax=Lentibacillus saliphilus TaxID=2737028 RepID=UPI001C30DD73|nr:UDP-N-acetylmuramoyl-tripeptide--D-alanyl-D-alanine ligase [Lentibacillus saliphilus]